MTNTSNMRGDGTTVPASPATRHWSDLLAIVVGVVLLGLAIWPGDSNASRGAAADVGSPQWVWIAHIVAALAALSSVFLAQRRERSGLPRLLLLLGAVALLAVFVIALMAGDTGTRAWLTLLLPAVLLFVASAGVGPMPRRLDADGTVGR
ncbi:MAG: hypothetical protein V4617_19505 [Gemmatimonadota bacterium]